MTTLIPRHHLFETLNLQDKSVIAVGAPTGCGKTILAQQLVNFLEYQVVWHDIDFWQQDSKRLHETSVARWQQALPDNPVLASDEEYTPASAAKQLTEYLTRNITDKACYILDNVQYLKGHQQAESWLNTVIATCPTHVQIILVGQALPNLNWLEIMKQGDVHWFNETDLAFTVADIQQLNDKVSFEEAEQLIETYHGWVSAIRLAVDSMLQRTAQRSLETPMPEKKLFKTLIEEFFNEQSVQHQNILLTVATTSLVNPIIYEDIANTADVISLLDTLCQQHLLITKTDAGYHLHDLLREYLQEELQRIQPERYCLLHLRVAQWFETHDELEKAIEHYLLADAKLQAIQLAEKIAQALHINGYWQTLLNINNLLADEDVPRLNLFASFILVDYHSIEESNHQLNQARAIFQSRADHLNLARVDLQYAYNLRQENKSQSALDIARRVMQQIPDNKLMQAWAYRIVGLAQLDLGCFEKAIQALQQTLSIMRAEGETGYMYIQVLQDLSEAYKCVGDHHSSIAMLQDVVAYYRDHSNKMALTLTLNNLSCSYHYSSNYREALKVLKQAKQLLPNQYGRYAAYVYHSLGDLNRDLGDFSTAQHTYAIARKAINEQDTYLLSEIIVSQCRLAVWKGSVFEALAHIKQVMQFAEIRSLYQRVLFVWQELFQFWHSPNQHDTTSLVHHLDELFLQKAFKPLSKIIGTLGYLGIKYENQVLLDSFRTIIGQLPQSFWQSLATDCHYLPILSNWISSKTNYWSVLVPHLNALHEIKNQSQVATTGNHHLELKMLGQDTVTHNGHTLPDTTWASPQARAFFYCLYFYGPQTKEELTMRLWSDYDKKRARNALRDVRKRIDTVLPSLIECQKGIYYFKPETMLTADITLFDQTIKQANQLPPRDAHTEDLYLRAISLYNDLGLLPNLYGDWLQPYHAHYEHLYVRALIGVAECAYARQDYALAIRHYETMLTIEPYQEEIYRKMMTCFAENRQQAQVQLTYNRLSDCLMEDLDLLPHPDTDQLLNRLLI